MRNIPFMGYLIVAVIALGLFIQTSFEVFSYVMEFENFKDMAVLASKVAMNQTTQSGIARASNMSDADYYQQKLAAAQGQYGLAQVQDGFIAVDPNELSGKYAGLDIPENQTYEYNLKMNMRDLVSRLGNDRYTSSDLPDDSFVKEDNRTQENSAYKNGDTSIKYEVSMVYKPRLSTTAKLLPLFNYQLTLHTEIQPINYIEP